MAAPLFDPSKCNIESIPSLGFDFVSECSVPDSPPPIFDCPLPLVPREPPPPPCPEFEGSARVSYYNRVCGDPSEPTAFTITKLDSDPCRFFIDLDLSIPQPEVPCPDIQGGSVRVTTGYADCVGEARGAITVTATPAEDIPCDESSASQAATACRFTIDLDLTVPVPRPPCPLIEAGTVTVTSGYRDCIGEARGSIRITATEDAQGDCSDGEGSAAQCQFTVDLDLTVPVPRPECPVIEAGSVSVNAGYADCVGPAGGVLTITPITSYRACSEGVSSGSSEAFCQYTIDLDLNVPIPRPPCPDVGITGTIEYLTGAAAPTISAVASTVEAPGGCDTPGSCRVDIELEIGIPKIPCPEISGDVTVFSANSPTGWLAVVPTETASGLCQFDLDINIGIPNARPCPVISGAIDVFYASAPTGVIAVVPTENASGVCRFDLEIDIGVPTARPCPTITGDVTVYYSAQPTGYLAVSPTENASGVCTFDLDINVGVPTARPCPIIRGDVTAYYADTPTGYLTVVPTESASGACTFDLDFFVGFPRSRPCPTITGEVTVYETYQPTGVITIVPNVPLDPALPCTYDLDINIGYRRTRLEKGNVTCAWTVCEGGDPTCDVTVHPPNASGVQLLDIFIYIPRPPVYTGGTIELRDAANNLYGSGNITVGATGCSRAVNSVVTLNVTTCSSTGGGGLSPEDPGYVPGGG